MMMTKAHVTSYPVSAQVRLWWDDLNHQRAYMPHRLFCYGIAYLLAIPLVVSH